MPPLSGFSDNPFRSRKDVMQAATSLLQALTPYKSSCGARIKLATATGTGFDEISAQLEGFARPLWVVADLLAAKSNVSANESTADHLDLNSWVRGLEAGVDPDSDTYWGNVGDHDQRMVEMEPIAYALLSSPSTFSPILPISLGLASTVQDHKIDKITTWLRSINSKEVPPSNWRWFRILVNLALVKSCGVPYHEVKPRIDEDFKILDSFYLGDGWSSDGLWSDDKKQADYYSGSFAIQYAQLAYVRFAHDLDPERVERYRSEAGKFSQCFWRYFNVDGAAIPFGRSLTYRFAFAAFWSAVAMTDIDLPPPLNDCGVIKGLLLRHLRWWAKQSDIFNTDGTLTIGYTYPNMYMSEDYNSPQSLYWCLKSFSVLGLPEEHPFWSCEELPHPLSTIVNQSLSQVLYACNHHVATTKDMTGLGPIRVVAPVVQITCSFQEHHFLLSAGQSTTKTHKAREAKYSKFAYSSAFAFSVPTGSLLPQMAPDSTLSISNDEGETWRTRWQPISARAQILKLSLRMPDNIESQLTLSPVLISTWRPWRASDFQIETILVPPLERWPGWHVRIHKLIWQTYSTCPSFQLIDAGFSISSQGTKGGVLPLLDSDMKALQTLGPRQIDEMAHEGFWEGNSACLILSDSGASGVAELPTRFQKKFSAVQPKDVGHTCRASVLKPDANTNLIAQRTLIPTLLHHFERPESSNPYDKTDSNETWLVTGVFAVVASAGIDLVRIREMWQDRPALGVEEYMDLL